MLACRSLALLPLLLVAACAAGEAASSSESNLDAVATPPVLETVKGREYARCWFDVTGDAAQLSCTSTARGKDPIGATVKVVAAAMGGTFTSLQKDLDIEAGGTVVLGSLSRSSFPVTLLMNAYLTADGRALIGEQKGTDIRRTLSLASPEEMSATKPGVIAQPYDLWPVAFLDGRDSKGYAVNVQEYERSIAPFTGFLGETTMKLRPTFLTRAQGTKPRWFVAPTAGAITASLSGGPRGVDRVSITEAGYYIVTESEFRLATGQEAARELGLTASSGPAGPSTDTPATTTDASSPPSTTPGPVDVDPTCGGDGQAFCKSIAKKCDDGTRYDSSASKCVACGDAGETYCTKSVDNFAATGGRCNDGTRYDSSASKCVACGDAGETYCTKSVDNFAATGGRCNDGTRYDSSASKCVTCGGEGQTYCTNATDNFTATGARCNAGLRYSSSSGTCVR